MSYKVIFNGWEVVCETFADLVKFTDEANSFQAAKNTPNTNNQGNSNFTPKSNGHPKGAVNEPVSYEAFIKSLTPKTRAALKVLSETGDEMSDTELRQRLGVEKKQQLAGTISSVFKGATRAGINVEDIFKRRPIFTPSGEKDFASQIPENMLETYRNVLNG